MAYNQISSSSFNNFTEADKFRNRLVVSILVCVCLLVHVCVCSKGNIKSQATLQKIGELFYQVSSHTHFLSCCWFFSILLMLQFSCVAAKKIVCSLYTKVMQCSNVNMVRVRSSALKMESFWQKVNKIIYRRKIAHVNSLLTFDIVITLSLKMHFLLVFFRFGFSTPNGEEIHFDQIKTKQNFSSINLIR